MMKALLPTNWVSVLAPYYDARDLDSVVARVLGAQAAGETVYPPQDQWFAALEATAPQDVRVVILGQDPYHGAGQAHGLCFSVRPGVRVPPSLKNIYKELADDVGAVPVRHGYLQHWAEQGVLLLNNVLTVEAGKPASHKGWGWEAFTDAVVTAVAADATPKVFILWGSHAQKKADKIKILAEGGPHLILRGPHPSPLSAYHGFFGSKPFSQANDFLVKNGRSAIDWQLPYMVDDGWVDESDRQLSFDHIANGS
ncbi:uracil-DNA glycosylase [Sphingopyxis yananensis]|uniref:uracil-DNA glycosylase n=1 Tax=Sphingopyxis yananensis TaxID=2886687 RepID=UPI001D10FA40|nr:uracil-DNA glycosylase [Sphingopyxis yananensis]MCC2601528.1 uracil-DNA glycosylase [Sphingopyxis yananensis]